jgi:hypothetical protein
MRGDDDEREGMDTSGEIRRRELEEAATREREREALERQIEAERLREAERRRRERE